METIKNNLLESLYVGVNETGESTALVPMGQFGDANNAAEILYQLESEGYVEYNKLARDLYQITILPLGLEIGRKLYEVTK